MTIFLPFQPCVFSTFFTELIFQEELKKKINAAKLQKCFTTSNSRFYPEISFQSIKKFHLKYFTKPARNRNDQVSLKTYMVYFQVLISYMKNRFGNNRLCLN